MYRSSVDCERGQKGDRSYWVGHSVETFVGSMVSLSYFKSLLQIPVGLETFHVKLCVG
jgi:hypothetical protein